MTKKIVVSQEHDSQVQKLRLASQEHDLQMSPRPQLPNPRKYKNASIPGHSKRRRSHGKETRERITAIVQLAGVATVVISLLGLIISIQQFNQQQQAAEKNALDQRYQATLDAYIDQMSTLLLQYHLTDSKADDPVRAVAQARTFTALRNIDPARQGTLVRFLWGANLINGPRPIISLSIVNITNANLSYAYLNTINLSGALLKGTDFQDSNLTNADLNNADLSDAQLNKAWLIGATLIGADLADANLSGVDTNLAGADMSEANLAGANLAGANLTGVNLTGANLAGADLRDATLTGATMPDGSKHP